MSNIEVFKEEYPSLDSYWRSIILFGRNVASYKFALAKTLLEFISSGKTTLSLEELSEPYSMFLCEHLLKSPKQVTSASSQFLEGCKAYNEKMITKEALLSLTVNKGFNNVIDAFHVVNNKELPIEFYVKDYDRKKKNIILTDEIHKLSEMVFFENFVGEAESRWNLVETAWELGISRGLLDVKYDDETKLFFVNNDNRRKSITSARGALNGYQKGKCFYCFDDLTISDGTLICDVDHFFPHSIQSFLPYINLDGVWNLVLSCPRCNRGENGKFARVPTIKYLARLRKRNEFLIGSHHPLRETLMNQTGETEPDRKGFLQNVDKEAINLLIHRWETEELASPVF